MSTTRIINWGSALFKGQYLSALDALGGAQTDSSQEAGAVRESRAQTLAMVGDVHQALEVWDSTLIGNEQPAVVFAPDVRPRNAIDAISEKARDRQIVILNEAHHLTQTRAFGADVAAALRKLGFSCFAAETFAGNIQDTQKNGYPSLNSGVYTLDPVFGNMVRDAVHNGWTLVPYEGENLSEHPDPVDSIRERETQQAKTWSTASSTTIRMRGFSSTVGSAMWQRATLERQSGWHSG